MCMLYLNKPEKVIYKNKYIEKRLHRALKFAYLLECRKAKNR